MTVHVLAQDIHKRGLVNTILRCAQHLNSIGSLLRFHYHETVTLVVVASDLGS